MRLTTLATLVLVVVAASVRVPDAHATSSGTPPPGYAEARARILDEGRTIGRLVAAGDAAALFARFTPEYAEELPATALSELLGRVLAAGPIGALRGESALPLDSDRRVYSAEHSHAGALLAVEVSFDARGRIAGISFRPRTPLPPDPGAGRRVRLRLPVQGTWWVWWGGPDERRNYHVISPAQRHAYDLVQWRRGGTARGSGTRNRDYFAFGRRVVAPAAGVVVAARDGVEDNRPQVELENPAAIAGNHVVLEVGAGRYVLLAHLAKGSVRVRVGQRVLARQLLGRVGNSGNSSEPHLHVHVQDTPRIATGIGLPVAFRSLSVDGEPARLATPEQGQFISARG